MFVSLSQNKKLSAVAVTLAATDGVEHLEECLGTFVRFLKANALSVRNHSGFLDELSQPPFDVSSIATPVLDNGLVVQGVAGVSGTIILGLLSPIVRITGTACYWVGLPL